MPTLSLIQPHPNHRGVNSVAETLIYERAKVALFAAIPIPHDPFHLRENGISPGNLPLGTSLPVL